MRDKLGILRFEETYFERIWGGNRLRELLIKPTPPEQLIGEAWLIADHTQCESVVVGGRHQGKTLRELMQTMPDKLLGSCAEPTPDGRFPLLLKLLDAGAPLSVQVHPNDDQARALQEPDVGKTEMWYVLDAVPGAELICGLDPGATAEDLRSAIRDNTVADLMRSFPAPAGTGVFVPAGTVHAIGAGFLLAEIQQNSDITYRVFDWGRVDTQGIPRELHIDKALQVVNFGSQHGGATTPLIVEEDDVERMFLAACEHFAAEVITVTDRWSRETGGRSFHLLLGVAGTLNVSIVDDETALHTGEAILIPGNVAKFTLRGSGKCLDYYVPDMADDILLPLIRYGYDAAEIAKLCGA